MDVGAHRARIHYSEATTKTVMGQVSEERGKMGRGEGDKISLFSGLKRGNLQKKKV